MFPQSFSASVSQRMTIWGAVVGFLFCLYGATEAIQAWQAYEIANARERTTGTLARIVADVGPGAGGQQSDIAKKLAVEVAEIKALDTRAATQRTGHSRNKLLLLMLILFVVAEIVVIEYRLLIKPIMRMVKVLQTGAQAVGKLGLYTRRHDEIGAFAQALKSHFDLVSQQQETARIEQTKLSDRLQNQDQFRRESLSFQERIADIVRHLEDHAGRMSTASSNLAKVSSSADQGATASAHATLRVSGNVNMVAGSIQDIASTLTMAAEGAEKTSAVAASARSAVETAKDDAKALTEAARTIEQVIALIEDVAGQTNLLALNATIEAARAGEMGRGFGVVAQEVKQLATRTARATEDVRGGLQGITAASLRIAERVARLAHSIDEVAAVASGIAQSLRQQGANSQSITSTTAQTAEDIRDVAANVKDVASMIGEAKQAAELVTKVSTDLGQQATDLRAAVERFIETTERIAA